MERHISVFIQTVIGGHVQWPRSCGRCQACKANRGPHFWGVRFTLSKEEEDVWLFSAVKRWECHEWNPWTVQRETGWLVLLGPVKKDLMKLLYQKQIGKWCSRRREAVCSKTWRHPARFVAWTVINGKVIPCQCDERWNLRCGPGQITHMLLWYTEHFLLYAAGQGASSKTFSGRIS